MTSTETRQIRFRTGEPIKLNEGTWIYLRERLGNYVFGRQIDAEGKDERIENFFEEDQTIVLVGSDNYRAKGRIIQTFRDGRNNGWESKQFLVRRLELGEAVVEYEDSSQEGELQ